MPKIEQGQARACIDTVMPLPADSMLPLSSAARLLMVAEEAVCGVQMYVQDSRPAAGCQSQYAVGRNFHRASDYRLLPSVAVPDTVTGTPTVTVAPALGEVIAEVGGVRSVERDAGIRPAWMAPG